MKAWTIFLLTVLLISQTVQAQTCPNGQNYNSQLNRCLTSNQTAKIKGATAHCMSKSSEAERKACYKQSAQTVIDENEAELTDVDESVVAKPFATSSSTKAILTSAVAVGVATYSIYKMSGKMKECRSPAMWLMLGGGLATAATEISTYLWLKSALKKLEKEYEGKITSTGSQSVDQQRKEANDAQKDALEYLAKRQDIIKKVAKTKGGAYTAVAAVYAAAAIISAIEVYKTYYGDQTGVCPELASSGGGLFKKGLYKQKNDLLKIALHNLENDQNAKNSYFLFQEYMHVISDINQSPNLNDYNTFDWDQNINESINFIEIAKMISSHIIPSAHAQFAGSGDPDDELKQLLENQSTTTGADTTGAGTTGADTTGGGTTGGGTTGGGTTGGGTTGGGTTGGGTTGGGTTGGGGAVTKGAVSAQGAEGPAMGMITKQLVRPETRLVLNGYLAYHAGKMASHAYKEGKKAEERAGQIRKITNEFTEGSGFVLCENEDRNNPAKPSCYCYTEANTINPNRKNSAVCQKVSGTSTVAQAGQYGDQVDSQFPFDKKVCVNNQNQIDHNCQCRSQVVKNGQNNCMKLQANFGGLPGLNSADFATNLTNDMNKLIGGNISAADLNAAQYGKMAAKLAAAKDNLLKQDKFKKVNDVANKLAPQMERLFESAARNGMPQLSVGGAPLMASSSNADSIPLPAMKEEVKQMLSKNNLYDESSSKNSFDKADKPIDIGLDDIAAGGVTIQDEQLKQAMNENYDYGNMDISSDNGSIFTILSNRYQMSGMRRLFKPAAQIEKKE